MLPVDVQRNTIWLDMKSTSPPTLLLPSHSPLPFPIPRIPIPILTNRHCGVWMSGRWTSKSCSRSQSIHSFESVNLHLCDGRRPGPVAWRSQRIHSTYDSCGECQDRMLVVVNQGCNTGRFSIIFCSILANIGEAPFLCCMADQCLILCINI